MLRVEFPSVYQIIFKNLTKVANCPTCGIMAHSFLVSFSEYLDVLNECVQGSLLEKDVLRIMSDLCSWRRVHAAKMLPAKSVRAELVRLLMRNLEKMDCVPLKLKINCG